MKTVTILRKWNHPQISITVTNESIGIEMSLHDFLAALADEAAEELVVDIAKSSGNPTFVFTNKQLQERLVKVIESERTNEILTAAANRIIDAAKMETSKVI